MQPSRVTRSTACPPTPGRLLLQLRASTCRFASDNSPPAEAAPGRTCAAPWLCPQGPPPRLPAPPAPPPARLASPGLPSASPLTVGTLPQLFADSPMFSLCSGPNALPCGGCVLPSSLPWTGPRDWPRSRAFAERNSGQTQSGQSRDVALLLLAGAQRPAPTSCSLGPRVKITRSTASVGLGRDGPLRTWSVKP